MGRFIRFGVVGAAGFVVDTAVLYLFLRLFGFDFYSSRLCSFMVAVTFTWYCNRIYTFADVTALASKHRENHPDTHNDKHPEIYREGYYETWREWGRFVLTNSVGGAANYGAYSLLIFFSAVVREYPVLGVAAGSVTGLMFNFSLSKKFVFRRDRDLVKEY